MMLVKTGFELRAFSGDLEQVYDSGGIEMIS
jgi:hypothetical protein